MTEGLSYTGYGHLTRCSAIYQAFSEAGITPLYILHGDNDGLNLVNDLNPIRMDWIKQTDQLFNLISGFDAVIIDSYLADEVLYYSIHKIVKKCVYIDDYIRIDYPEGILINGSIEAQSLPYLKKDNSNYLLGTQYIPLRKEFWDLDEIKFKATKNSVLLTFGGTDQKLVTFKILDYLIEKLSDVNYKVILAANIRDKNLTGYINQGVKFYTSLSAAEMKNLMLENDVVITAAGQTTYELARLSKKIIAVGVAENQRKNIEGWIANNYLTKEIWYDDSDMLEKINDELKIKINKEQTTINFVDGQGARRICRTIIE